MRMWRFPIGFLVLAGFALVVFWGLQKSEVARALPTDVVLFNIQGEPVRLSDYQGQPVIINFWATWCPPCIREMPLLATYAEKEGFQLVLINQAESADTIQRYLDEAELEFEHMLMDSHQVAYQEMQVRGLPTTQFFDAEGRLVNEHLGEVHDRDLDAFIERNVNHNKSEETFNEYQ